MTKNKQQTTTIKIQNTKMFVNWQQGQHLQYFLRTFHNSTTWIWNITYHYRHIQSNQKYKQI